MKRHTKILIALGVVLVLGGGVVAWRWESLLRAYVFYRVRSVTTGLPHSDRVEVYRLNGNTVTDNQTKFPKPGEGFPVRAYGNAEAGILGHVTLDGADAEGLAALWRAQKFDGGLQKLCHSPVWGLRFYADDRMLFETSICFHCSNFYVTDRLLGSGWWGFDTDAPPAKELGHRLQGLFSATPGHP